MTTSCRLSYGSLLLLFGRLADVVGSKRMFLFGTGFFAIWYVHLLHPLSITLPALGFAPPRVRRASPAAPPTPRRPDIATLKPRIYPRPVSTCHSLMRCGHGAD